MMKKIIVSLSLLCLAFAARAIDTVYVKQTTTPVLIDRVDNALFYIRIDAKTSQMVDEIKLEFAESNNQDEIAAVKLFYGGTEAPERRKRGMYFRPVQYISSYNERGMTRAANPSYSVKIDEQQSPSGQVVFKPNYNLFPGINYFWVSLQMKPNTSLLSTVEVDLVSVKLDGEKAAIAKIDKILPKRKTGLFGKLDKISPLAKKSSTAKQNNAIRHRMGIGVRHSGDDGASAYRIPGLVTANDGSLLAVYDVRYNSSVDLQEYVDVGLSRSTDKGQSWEDMRIPLQFGEYGGMPKAQNGVGDPSILVDAKTGTVWIAALWTHGMGNRRTWHNSRSGMSINETGQLVLAKSTDNGKTWSEPINITPQVKDPSWRLLLQGPGRGITMHDGTLVFPIQFIDSTAVPFAGIMYSKDGGETWTIHNPARSKTTESQVAEVSPGVLMLNMRDNRGGSRAVSITRDLGQTWSEHPSSRKELREPICMASLLQVNAADNVLGKDILLFSNPNSTNNRNMITIKASLDGGLSFPTKYQVLLDEELGWGYSCLTMIDNETVGILYESSVAHMTFQAVKLTDIIKEEK